MRASVPRSHQELPTPSSGGSHGLLGGELREAVPALSSEVLLEETHIGWRLGWGWGPMESCFGEIGTNVLAFEVRQASE